MSETDAPRDCSTYDSELIDEWLQQEASATPGGPLKPSAMKPIENNMSPAL